MKNYINLENLGENKPCLYGAELAAGIRADLKRRGADGCTVRSSRGSGITVTVKATAADFASLEEMRQRLTFSYFCCKYGSDCRGFFNGSRWIYPAEFETMTEEQRETEYNNFLVYSAVKLSGVNTHYLTDRRADYYELTTAFYNKLVAVFRIANQWNYDNSDPMSDYFDVGYYLDIDIKKPADFSPRETMTEEEKEDYRQEQEEEQRKEEEARRKYEEEQREREAAAEAYQKREAAALDLIKNNVTVEDLDERKQIYISDIVGGIGKECNIEELENEIAENPHYCDALITRAVTFKTAEAFRAFCDFLLCDFDFLAGFGGTASEDVRLENVREFWQLTEEQRETVKFFNNNCVAVFSPAGLELVVDPQGYNYARYVFKLSDTSRITTAAEELKRQEDESRRKPAFYFPDPVAEQVKKLNIGDDITVYQCDGWLLNSIYGGAGTITNITPGNYAQYNGVYIDLMSGRKSHRVFIRDNKQCLIYSGLFGKLPEEVTQRQITHNMSELYNYDQLFPNVLKYHKRHGRRPVVDTWQR